MKRAILDRTRLNNLKARIAESEEKKRELKEYIRQLHEKYSRKEISYSFYIETLYKKFDGKDVLEWVEHFEDYIKDCRKRIKKEVRTLVVKHISIIIFSLAILVFILKYIIAKI
ncbi:MAG: hypothetical protein PHH00_03435 [Candidatus Nanoarchaeia archaeon]|nr:hypothetical protein [Candidatus Nanoarchaeia archaeon]